VQHGTDQAPEIVKAQIREPGGGAGRDLDFQRIQERAYHLKVAAGDQTRGARTAFWLGLTCLLRGETGIATGWLSRAGRLIESRDCVGQGYLLVPLAEQELVKRNADAAHAASGNAGRHWSALRRC
jgi:hypothetical protein